MGLCLIKVAKLLSQLMGNYISSFSVKVSIHQRSALSPLLFIMVIYVLTENVKDGSLMELMYADDLNLCGESLNEVIIGEYCC